jgi:hypothetical protein
MASKYGCIFSRRARRRYLVVTRPRCLGDNGLSSESVDADAMPPKVEA